MSFFNRLFSQKGDSTLVVKDDAVKGDSTLVIKGDTILDEFGDLYHEYSVFGVKNKQLPGIYRSNQRCKGPIIGSYIQYAIAKSKQKMDDSVTFAELFCADAYYAMLAIHFGAQKAYGIDSNRGGYSAKSEAIARKLQIANYQFLQTDIATIEKLPRVDIVANVGGLYHVSNPREILEKSYQMANKFLIVQTVVSLANDLPDYFETPAPGWTWGSRYNPQSFDKMIAAFKWNIIDQHFNELEGNDRREDRGSVYYLIKK